MTAETKLERNARYQREYRARKALAATTEVRGIYAHEDDHARIKEYAAKLARKRVRTQEKLG